MKYAIAEMFVSPQGEGAFSGTIMQFVRTAGCSVGKFMKDTEPYELCESVTGKKFLCDTNFKVSERLDDYQIANLIPDNVEHVCITGGEPLNQNLSDLIEVLFDRGKYVHIETSGTQQPEWFVKLLETLSPTRRIWITVSPKVNALQSMAFYANEIKLLVDMDFDILKVPNAYLNHSNIYLTPINGVDRLDQDTMAKAIAIAMRNPRLQITVQMHKVLGVR